MIVIGHRGAAGHEPENTLRSIARAIEMGVDWVEIDVQVVDGQLIVLHDDYVDRTTNGRGRPRDIGFDKLRALDAGQGERVPLLSEVIDLIDARVGLNIEIKGADLVPAVTRMVRDCLHARPDWRGRFLLSSFDTAQTEQLVPNDGDWLVGVLFSEGPDAALARALRLKAWSINPSRKQLTKKLVQQAHVHGIKVLVYTVNEPGDIHAMQTLDVDGVFSDFPDRVLASVGR